ncbi:MAG: helix-turn-helix domain-containing protein [Caedimonadaceae bacterium]|nr:MAG: helix-turn-helix domain-containing protein [Caedimonadaceae bacterium]
MNEDEPYLSARELAKRWRIPIATLRQWRWLKKGPHFRKVEGRTLYYLKDVLAFEEAALRHHTTMDSPSFKKLF